MARVMYELVTGSGGCLVQILFLPLLAPLGVLAVWSIFWAHDRLGTGAAAFWLSVCGVFGTAVYLWLQGRGPKAEADQEAATPTPSAGQDCEGCGQVVSVSVPQLRCGHCTARYHEPCWQSLGSCISKTCDPDRGRIVAREIEGQAAVRCPFCRDDLHEPDDVVACDRCGTRYHSDCLEEAGCVLRGCEQESPIPQRGRARS